MSFQCFQTRPVGIIVSLLDAALVLLTVKGMELAIRQDPYKIMYYYGMDNDAVNFALSCAGITAAVGCLSFLTQAWSIYKRKRACLCRFYAWKFLIVVIITIALYLGAGLYIKDYYRKLDTLVQENYKEFIIFEILKPHPAVLGILSYQIISFVIIHHFINSLRKVSDIPAVFPLDNDIEIGPLRQPPPQFFPAGQSNRCLGRRADPPPSPLTEFFIPPPQAESSLPARFPLADKADVNNQGVSRKRRLPPTASTHRLSSLDTIPEGPSQETSVASTAVLSRTQGVVGVSSEEDCNEMINHEHPTELPNESIPSPNELERSWGLMQAKDKEDTFPNPDEYFYLRKKCLSEGTRYIDPDFQPIWTGFLVPYIDRDPAKAKPDEKLIYQIDDENVEWKRPHEISRHPKFFTKGHSKPRVMQGLTGNGLPQVAVELLMTNPEAFERTVPRDNCWSSLDEYAGIFRFRFKKNYFWREVIIDDLLPTIDGKLICMHSTDRNEFWQALLEKAYAKFNKGYQRLNWCRFGRAMEDMTGAKIESIYLSPCALPLEVLFSHLERAFNNNISVTCGLNRNKVFGVYEFPETPRYCIRVYVVTAVKKTIISSKGPDPVHLIRVRDPWSKVHKLPALLHLYNQIHVGLAKENKSYHRDGQLWFPIKEFVEYFYNIEICSQLPQPEGN